jgi:tetratricopeptide (TPR) repeat protein
VAAFFAFEQPHISGGFMKLLTILVFLAPTMLPLMAEDQALIPGWAPLALKAQAQLWEGRFAEAAESAQTAMKLAKHSGPPDKRLASNYHLLGVVYREWGHCAESRANYLHAIAIWRKLPDANRAYAFRSITSLISVMVECDDFPAAEKMFRAYEPELERDGSAQIDRANMLSLRAAIARHKKDYQRSESLYRQSIELLEKTPEAKPIDIAVEWSSLAVVLAKEGRQVESLAESDRAIDFFERSAPRHPSLVASLNNAACTLADMGRRDESERLFRRALAGAEDLYGEDSRITAKIILSYARLLRESKEPSAAADLQKRGAEAFRHALARDNGTVDAAELKALGK